MSNYKQQIENIEIDDNFSGHWKNGHIGAISDASKIGEFADVEIAALRAKLAESERLREQAETKFRDCIRCFS